MIPKSIRRALVLTSVTLLAAACTSSTSHRSVPTTSPSSASGPSTSTSSPSAPSSSTPSVFAVAPVHWVACQGGAGPKGYQCATLQVPRDPEHPGQGGTIGLALDRRPASGAKIGALLVNPGGPGASGVDFLPQIVAIMPKSLLARFDVIGFDPPGVGRSAPINCLDQAGLKAYFHVDPEPTTPAAFEAMLAADRTFAAGCERMSGAELPYVSTVDAAMDMDYIRQAVGDQKLDYLGFSYGTYLGATYARLYPERIRAMVLDGAEDPSLAPIPSLDDQSAGFDHNLQAALQACASSSSCPWKPGGDPVASFQQLLAEVRANAVPVPGSSDTVGPAEMLGGSLLTLYDQSYWKYLYQALAELADGNGTLMLDLFKTYLEASPDGSYPNLLEAEVAVNCLDAPAPAASAIEADRPHAAAVAPVFGVANLYSEFQCGVWPVPPTGRPGPVTAAGSPPILVVGSTGDPATPYEEARSLASQLQHGVLLTRVGFGHTAYPYSSCIRDYVDKYLVDLTTPPAGTTCQTS